MVATDALAKDGGLKAARDELERFSPANCPMSEDDLHWSATHSRQPAL